jgi:hypothetical protein
VWLADPDGDDPLKPRDAARWTFEDYLALDRARLGLTRLVTEARDRLHTLIANAMADQHIPEQLDAILEQLIDQVDADPELRRQVVRESLRSSLFSTFWLR